jgi:catechol 2,3-dioxygenase-like lactoylglutathione lyase family enzyme
VIRAVMSDGGGGRLNAAGPPKTTLYRAYLGTNKVRTRSHHQPLRAILGRMAVIERLDFLGVPTQDPARSRAFYRDVLGMRPDEHAQWEQWAGDTCFGIWEPEKQGMPFVAQKGNPWPLRCDDVAEMRAALEARGVQFFGDTIDTGVCHMAIFADPDGNQLMLHRRYAPYE